MVRPRLVLFGDSITEQSFRPGGWGAALADTYSRKVF
jgi:isoamyl acetate esterase